MDTGSSALVAFAFGFIAAVASVIGYAIYRAVLIFVDYFFKNPRLPGDE